MQSSVRIGYLPMSLGQKALTCFDDLERGFSGILPFVEEEFKFRPEFPVAAALPRQNSKGKKVMKKLRRQLQDPQYQEKM